MELKGTRTFSAHPQQVWAALHDASILQSCIPGAEEFAWQGDSAVSARVSVGIGPFKGTGTLQAQVTEQVAPTHLKLVMHRQGAHNSADGALVIDLAPDSDAGTIASYSGTAVLGGPIAAIDNPLTRPFIDQALDQFFARLERSLD
jgi:uncharacterized protein